MSLQSRRGGSRLAKSVWALSTGLFGHRQVRKRRRKNKAQPAPHQVKHRSPMATEHSPWWRPDKHQDRRPFLLARGRIQRAIRSWFEARGFIEVEAAALQVSPGNETHLHAFATELVAPGGERRSLYLHTSPEFACKKLLAAGEDRIFTFAPVFRNSERGALHHP